MFNLMPLKHMIKRIDINFKIVDEYKKAQLSGRSKQNSSRLISKRMAQSINQKLMGPLILSSSFEYLKDVSARSDMMPIYEEEKKECRGYSPISSMESVS